MAPLSEREAFEGDPWERSMPSAVIRQELRSVLEGQQRAKKVTLAVAGALVHVVSAVRVWSAAAVTGTVPATATRRSAHETGTSFKRLARACR